jgi:nucleotide-binding universal stress UspA family protein
MYQRIVVPLDGSEFAEKALPEAERLARLTQAPIHLIHVVDVTPVPWYGLYASTRYTVPEVAHADHGHLDHSYLEIIAQRLRQSGFRVDFEMCRGQISRMLCRATKPGDVIVMASHGRSGLPRWIIGSVAEEVLRQTPVPVHLIKITTPITATPGMGTAAAEADIAT